jgi:predicted TIM-barrel fold metal-dependent hydrolase
MSEVDGRATIRDGASEMGSLARPVALGAAESVAGPRPGAGLVDAHVHIFPPEIIRERETYLRRDAWFSSLYESPKARMVTADETVAHMDPNGVGMSVVFGFAFRDPGLCSLVNDYVIESVRRHPDRLAGLACVSPDAPGAVAELERCLDAGLHGCGELMPDGQGFWRGGSAGVGGRAAARRTPASEGLAAVARCLEERNLPLLVHANEPVGHEYRGKGGFTPEACFALARAHPALAIVFAHMGGGLFLYELMPEVRVALANVHYDTSAVPYLYGPDVYAVAVSCAGEGKLIFGSDYPLLSPGRYLEGLNALAPTAREAALSGNARKVFGL